MLLEKKQETSKENSEQGSIFIKTNQKRIFHFHMYTIYSGDQN